MFKVDEGAPDGEHLHDGQYLHGGQHPSYLHAHLHHYIHIFFLLI